MSRLFREVRTPDGEPQLIDLLAWTSRDPAIVTGRIAEDILRANYEHKIGVRHVRNRRERIGGAVGPLALGEKVIEYDFSEHRLVFDDPTLTSIEGKDVRGEPLAGSQPIAPEVIVRTVEGLLGHEDYTIIIRNGVWETPVTPIDNSTSASDLII